VTFTENINCSDYAHLSHETIRLAQKYAGSVPKRELASHVAFWCRGLPSAHSDPVYTALGLEHHGWSQTAERNNASSAAAQLANAVLEESIVPLFLYRDCIPVAELYQQLAPRHESLKIFFGRLQLGGGRLPRPYAHLASLVNRAALQAEGDWWTFVATHNTEYWKLVRNTDVGCQIQESMDKALAGAWPKLSRATSEGKRIVVTDTGMQASFALPIAACIRRRLGLSTTQVDVQLLGTYVWLVELFGDRAVRSDPKAVAAVELEAEKSSKSAVSVSTNDQEYQRVEE